MIGRIPFPTPREEVFHLMFSFSRFPPPPSKPDGEPFNFQLVFGGIGPHPLSFPSIPDILLKDGRRLLLHPLHQQHSPFGYPDFVLKKLSSRGLKYRWLSFFFFSFPFDPPVSFLQLFLLLNRLFRYLAWSTVYGGRLPSL